MIKSALSTIHSGISSLKDPDYTGRNRCPPCTGVNVGLAVLFGFAVGTAVPVLGVATFGLALAVIYFRGYLVPGTPTLTKRYLPDSVLARFEHEPPVLTDGGGNPLEDAVRKIQYRKEHSVDPERYLQDAEVVETTDDGRTLTPSFKESAEEHAAAFDGVVDVEFIAEMYDVTPDEVSVPEYDYPAIETRRRVRQWPSEAAFIVDVAVHEVLQESRDDWLDVPVEQRARLLRSIRSLWETCPTCGGSVSFDEETATSCCREFEVVTYRCQSCDSHFVEMDPEDVDEGTAKKGFIP
ncbi:hypothetical protein C479_03206 [Halovivax asiaticus JCM 14624]|uniref:Uncharacterized protein n=1 Tax=Halovivax asiaticus JCM 14624 TaxID=1227490 RepID=M0BS98_9EURY|nr:hypothetical protein [Halovivax asiaticus]ELZ13820.1 hypothetical protein C479_03206 [Halovivax asiaticus JCM 14624]